MLILRGNIGDGEKNASLREKSGMSEVGGTVSKALLQSERQWRFDLGWRRRGGGACMMSLIAMGRLRSSKMEASAEQFPGIGGR